MFVDFNLYVKYLSDHKMTADQFAYCWMIYHKDMNNIEKYVRAVGPFSQQKILDLMERGYILTSNPGSSDLYLGELVVTPKFTDQILFDIGYEEEVLDDFIRIYPPFVMVQGTRYSTTSIDRESISRYYVNQVLKRDKIKHKMIIEKTKKVVKLMEIGEIAIVKLDKFIRGHQWNIPLEGEGDKQIYQEL